ncbi:MAG TPA: hypothetical protein VFM82_06255 [Flavobacteriaceae bacterium]|nr:hypothetical protein [Flavobacteriaceae bacterium]
MDLLKRKILKAEHKIWVENALLEIAQKTEGYSPREKLNAKISYLQNVFDKVPTLVMTDEEWEIFVLKSNEVLEQIPRKEEGKTMQYRNYLKRLSSFRNYIRQEFNFVPKGFYLRIFVALGIILGVVLGLFLRQISITILLGMGLGLIVGSYLDRKSERKNKVL